MDYTKTGFSDSHGSSVSCDAPAAPSEAASLRRLSEDLRALFESSGEAESFADARVVVAGGREIAVHRCVLAARSAFFRGAFGGSERRLELRAAAGGVKVGFEAAAAVLAYLYGGRVAAARRGVCACVDEECAHAACRPAVEFLAEALYASFTFQVSELVEIYQRHLLDILDKIEIDDLLVVLRAAISCEKACARLLKRCVDTTVKSNLDAVTLDKALPQNAVKQIADARSALGAPAAGPTFPDKHAKRIHRALDSDDVELVRMLLREARTNLDDARALHYAVAHCDAKTAAELLDLSLGDVNCRDSRGLTVLHVAAMRREPKMIVSLLTKGARPSDLTLDGRKALQITKRLTRAADHFGAAGDRLCIEILEQAERRDPLLGEAAVSLALAGDDLRMKLLYLENRVGLAKLLFPMEAKVVMDISQIDGTCEFLDGLSSKNLAGGKSTTVDLNEAPFKIQEEHLIRLKALSRTVELGKRFFPRCSEVLNKIMDTDDMSQLAYLRHDTPAERLAKKRRYIDLQQVLTKAFDEDKEEINRSAISSSSSSTSIRVVRPNNGKISIKK